MVEVKGLLGFMVEGALDDMGWAFLDQHNFLIIAARFSK